MKKNKNGANKKYISLALVLFVMVVFVTGLIFLTAFELARYEDGIIDVCATQQDSYVQLVIDQINLKENRTDQEIIENILKTLDSSSNRYWTFSKDQTMLYVKDALETNRYQSLTADSYYTSESATRFIENLMVNKVIHERITLDDKDYVASGALFRYGDEEYRICLLTNTMVLLDNNKFLGSKMELIIIFIVVYSLVFIMPVAMTMIYNFSEKRISETEIDLVRVNKVVEKLNEKVATSDIYDNRTNLFQMPFIKVFMNEYINRREAFPISFIAFKYGAAETVSKFFGRNCVILGKRDIRFYDGKDHLGLILCVKCSSSKAKEIAAGLKGDFKLMGVETAMTTSSLDKRFKSIMKAMGNPSIEKNAIAKGIRPDSRTESRFRTREVSTEG